ncbi:hypothetical protein [Candidatus Poriferisodalis sp.]|uniref:hypothetical protein n=1 Tax=Candidatus Poriferisodalis sp. TaxID=3101277 RepID=UPI003B016DF4
MTGGLFDGECVHGVQIGTQTVDVWIRLYQDEIVRRRALGVGPITDRFLPRALMDLPHSEVVPFGRVDGGTLLALEELLAIGAVEARDEGIVRTAVPAVGLVGISKPASKLYDAQLINWLGCHAPLFVVVTARLARHALRAVHPQTGIALIDGEIWRVLRPAGRERVVPSWQRWSIAETVFDRYLQQISAAPQATTSVHRAA